MCITFLWLNIVLYITVGNFLLAVSFISGSHNKLQIIGVSVHLYRMSAKIVFLIKSLLVYLICSWNTTVGWVAQSV
jgi:hypothetical protein